MNFLESLFNPKKMPLRRNMNMFVSICILILASYLVAIPYMTIFEQNAYETYCVMESYNFRVFDEETSKEVPFTEEEKAKLGDKYIYTTVDEFKNIDFVVEGTGIKLPASADSLENVEYNHKEYVFKREVYYFDNDGTKLDKTDIYYIHVFWIL